MLRQLRMDGLRTVLTILSISAVIAVILILEGFLTGLYVQLRVAVLNRGGDLIVVQSGVSNFIATRSLLPQTSRADVEAVDGVKIAHPLTGISLIYEKEGRRTPVVVIVYDELGAPRSLASGSAISRARGIVIDQALASEYGLGPGDIFTLSDFDFVVKAVSSNTAAFMTPFVFITFDGLLDFYLESDVGADISTFPLLSFLLAELDGQIPAKEVAARIEARVPEVDVYFPHELARNDEQLGREMMGPVLNLLLFVSYGIGTLIVMMFMYMTVRSRLRDFGVAIALGFQVRTIVLVTLLESALLTSLAIPIGIGVAAAFSRVMETQSPIYLILSTEPSGIVRTSIAALLFAVLGTLGSLRSIGHLDPATVFSR